MFNGVKSGQLLSAGRFHRIYWRERVSGAAGKYKEEEKKNKTSSVPSANSADWDNIPTVYLVPLASLDDDCTGNPGASISPLNLWRSFQPSLTNKRPNKHNYNLRLNASDVHIRASSKGWCIRNTTWFIYFFLIHIFSHLYFVRIEDE